jgi:hypothetical protein
MKHLTRIILPFIFLLLQFVERNGSAHGFIRLELISETLTSQKQGMNPESYKPDYHDKNDLQKSEGSNSTPFENHALPIPQIINF